MNNALASTIAPNFFFKKILIGIRPYRQQN